MEANLKTVDRASDSVPLPPGKWPTSTLAHLAQFAAGIRLADVPKEVRQQAKLSILDTIGCVVAGSENEEAKILLDSERKRNTRPEASVLCAKSKLSIEAAVRVNGYMGDVFELHDLIGGHASIGNVTASMALAEATHASGTKLLEAVITGIEVTAHIYAAFHPTFKPYTEVGMAPVGIPSSIGVAAAAAKLLGLDRQQTLHAMAIAGSLAGWCPAEVIFGDGGTIKPMLIGGWPATVGIMGGMYAKDGLGGPPRLLESDIGFYSTAAGQSNLSAALAPMEWYLTRPPRKLHAACSYIHAAVETIGQMRRAGVRFEDAAEIRIGVAPYVVRGVSKSNPPSTQNEARFHAEYCFAHAALGADVITPEHSMRFAEYIVRPDFRSMMGKFRIAPDPAFSHYYQCSVCVVDGRGSVVKHLSGVAPKGSPANPLTRVELCAKFRRLVGSKLTPPQIEEYIEKIDELDKPGDWLWLVTSFD